MFQAERRASVNALKECAWHAKKNSKGKYTCNKVRRNVVRDEVMTKIKELCRLLL